MYLHSKQLSVFQKCLFSSNVSQINELRAIHLDFIKGKENFQEFEKYFSSSFFNKNMPYFNICVLFSSSKLDIEELVKSLQLLFFFIFPYGTWSDRDQYIIVLELEKEGIVYYNLDIFLNHNIKFGTDVLKGFFEDCFDECYVYGEEHFRIDLKSFFLARLDYLLKGIFLEGSGFVKKQISPKFLLMDFSLLDYLYHGRPSSFLMEQHFFADSLHSYLSSSIVDTWTLEVQEQSFFNCFFPHLKNIDTFVYPNEDNKYFFFGNLDVSSDDDVDYEELEKQPIFVLADSFYMSSANKNSTDAYKNLIKDHVFFINKYYSLCLKDYSLKDIRVGFNLLGDYSNTVENTIFADLKNF